MLKQINKRSVYEILIVFWIFIASFYAIHTDPLARSHDFIEHVYYTQVIISEERLPSPMESWLSYHPPLYYILCSTICPIKVADLRSNFRKNLYQGLYNKHINTVRALSILFGLITIISIIGLINRFTKNNLFSILIVMFISSIPKFVYTFTNYTNDGLITMICILIIVTFFSIIDKKVPSKKDFIVLTLLTSIGFYTKYTITFCLIPISIICLYKILTLKKEKSNYINILISFLIGFLSLFPWLYFHNYKTTGELIPVQFHEIVNKKYDLKLMKDSFVSITNLPFLKENKSPGFFTMWKYPWAYPFDDPFTKQYDYLSFSFSTAIVGEFIYDEISLFNTWLMFFIILFFVFLSITLSINSKSSTIKYSILIIFLSHLCHFLNSLRIIPPIHGCFLDFRFLAWTYVLWAILLANTLHSTNKLFINKVLAIILAIGIINQCYIVLWMR